MRDIRPLTIPPDLSIRQTLERMDSNGRKILFVLGRGQKLKGVVTDGDLRRWILKGGGLEEPIERAMQRRPVVLQRGFAASAARNALLRDQIECVPVVDEKGRIVSAVWWMDLFNREPAGFGKKENIPVVVMAGGEGHRLGPLTKILPKPLVPIGEKPIVELILERFAFYGSRDFFLTLGYKSRIVKAYFQETETSKTRRVRFVEEKKPLGTAGGLHLLRGVLKKTFWVSNCDILIDADFSDILRVHREQKNAITIVGSLKHLIIPYGVCHTEENGALKSMSEKPSYDFLINTGVYLLEPEILSLVPPRRFFHFTDLVNAALRNKARIGVYPISEKSWMDMGQMEELKTMSRRFGVDL